MIFEEKEYKGYYGELIKEYTESLEFSHASVSDDLLAYIILNKDMLLERFAQAMNYEYKNYDMQYLLSNVQLSVPDCCAFVAPLIDFNARTNTVLSTYWDLKGAVDYKVKESYIDGSLITRDKKEYRTYIKFNYSANFERFNEYKFLDFKHSCGDYELTTFNLRHSSVVSPYVKSDKYRHAIFESFMKDFSSANCREDALILSNDSNFITFSGKKYLVLPFSTWKTRFMLNNMHVSLKSLDVDWRGKFQFIPIKV